MILLRRATANDCPLILKFIKELASYEKLLDKVEVNEELLNKWLFIKKIAYVIIAEYSGKPVGFALYFFTYSTFVGKATLYLEDLYVKKEYRGQKIGIALFKELVRAAQDEDCGRMEWSCLKWNTKSIAFYERLKAVPMKEWDIYRLTADKFNDIIGNN